jgi:hypothetical protein
MENIHRRIDELFKRDAAVYGGDLAPYSGHVHRVAELTARQVDLQEDWAELIAVAAYYHDAAIWFDHTWDYLPGSERLALAELGDAQGGELVTAMIDEHHRVRRARNPHPLVEAMRRADATDVYRITMPPKVTRGDYRAMIKRFPDAGCYPMLARGLLMGLREGKRLNPMPMMKF